MKKYDPEVFVAMREGGLSNRRIAELLGVNEASVRRGLKKVVYEPSSQSRIHSVLAELGDVLLHEVLRQREA